MKEQEFKGKIELKARGAWTFILAQLLWWFICIKVFLAVAQFDRDVAKWTLAHPTLYNAVVTILTDGWLLLTAFWCSKSKTIHDFIDGTGLSLRPTSSALPFVLAAVGLGIVSIVGAMKGLTGGNWVAEVFAKQGKGVWEYYVIYGCLVTPFAEEVAGRGFLYRAFRGSYGILPSLTFVICWELFEHWSLASHSLFELGIYISFFALVCIVREKTGSIWNCIFCHAVSNAVVVRQWAICIILLLVFQSSCLQVLKVKFKRTQPRERQDPKPVCSEPPSQLVLPCGIHSV